MKKAGHSQAISQQGHYAGAVSRLAAFVIDQAVATTAYSLGTAVIAWTIGLVTNQEVDVQLTVLERAGHGRIAPCSRSP